MERAVDLLIRSLDDHSSAIFVYVPPQNVVLFQAFIELYEGLAAVRTVDREGSIVCLIASNDLLDDCRALLDALQPELLWQVAREPSDRSWLPL